MSSLRNYLFTARYDFNPIQVSWQNPGVDGSHNIVLLT